MALAGRVQSAGECPLLVAKRTLTNRCLPTRFMSTRLNCLFWH